MMQTTSHVQLTISGLPYSVLFILDWGDEYPLFPEELEQIHKYLAGVFKNTPRDMVPGHTVMIEVMP